MSDAERQDVLAQRQFRGGSWRRPPVWESGSERYLITAACYEHAPYIGKTPVRLSEFETSLLSVVDSHASCIYAHVVLPNHYHLLLESKNITELRNDLGQLHGKTSYHWNKEAGVKGRKVFHGSAETVMKSERHFQATLNYVHHNPVKHGYVKHWQDWPYSSARAYLTIVGREEAINHWLEYPVDDYGKEWDL